MGVAAIAIAVAAFGVLYARSTAPQATSAPLGSSSGKIALAGYRPQGAADGDAMRQRVRNYQSEVTAALARQGENPTAPTSDESYADADDLFDIDPLDDVEAYPSPTGDAIPSPTGAVHQNPVAYSTDGPVNPDASANGAGDPPPSNATAVDQSNSGAVDDYGQSGSMSDSDVYRLVVNNLSDDQRADFTRAYASMSAEQRADLLDGFRQQIQGGQ